MVPTPTVATTGDAIHAQHQFEASQAEQRMLNEEQLDAQVAPVPISALVPHLLFNNTGVIYTPAKSDGVPWRGAIQHTTTPMGQQRYSVGQRTQQRDRAAPTGFIMVAAPWVPMNQVFISMRGREEYLGLVRSVLEQLQPGESIIGLDFRPDAVGGFAISGGPFPLHFTGSAVDPGIDGPTVMHVPGLLATDTRARAIARIWHHLFEQGLVDTFEVDRG